MVDREMKKKYRLVKNVHRFSQIRNSPAHAQIQLTQNNSANQIGIVLN